MSAREITGTVTFCSPASKPFADARIRKPSSVRLANMYAPVASVVVALPALTPFSASTRAPAIPPPLD